jgi:hypothetical protein
MSYRITKYTFEQAKKLGVTVKPSIVQGKKIDVFKNGTKIASVGALGYNDYPTFMRLEREKKVPSGTANLRRKAYKIRHQKDRTVRGSNGYYADKLLW